MARRKITVPDDVGIEIAQALESGDKRMIDAMWATYTTTPWLLKRGKIYSIAKEYGWKSGRKTRSDKGEIKVPGVDEDKIRLIAKTIAASSRPKLGKRLVSTETIREQLVMNGHSELANMSISTINRQLRTRGLGHEQMTAGNPAIQMRSRFPNHIHFMDASICAQWDLSGKKTILPHDMQIELCKNKPEHWRKRRKVLIRYLVVDHCSGAFYVDYAYASGENASDMLSVLLDAWRQKPEIASRYPFHGVPLMLGLDRGPGNTSHAVKTLLEKLGVEPWYHSPGNSRASGVVEQLHSFWENSFEWQLLHEVADDLGELRARAHDAMIFLNSGREHSRHGKTRINAWMQIKQEQLRLLPPKAHCMSLATSKPVKRTPDEQLRISFNNTLYQLFAPARKKQPVLVDHHPWQAGDLNVWTQDGQAVECHRIEKDQYGFDRQAPVFGEGEFKRHSDTPAEALKNALKTGDKREQLQGFRPQPQAHLVPEQHYLPRRGNQIVLDNLPPEPPIRAGAVGGRLRKALELERLTPEMRQALDEQLNGKDVLSPEQFDELVQWARDAWSEHLPESTADRFTNHLEEDTWQVQAPSG